jgi:hypothetical protein
MLFWVLNFADTILCALLEIGKLMDGSKLDLTCTKILNY